MKKIFKLLFLFFKLFDFRLKCIRCGKRDFEYKYWNGGSRLSHAVCRNCFALYRYTTMNQKASTTYNDKGWELD